MITKEEVLALLAKANDKYTNLKELVDSLNEKLAKVGDKGDNQELFGQIKSLNTQVSKFEDLTTDLKEELANLKSENAKPVLAISLKENTEALRRAVKTGVGKFVRQKDTNASFSDFIATEVKALNLTNSGEGLESVEEVLSREIIERAREAYPIIGDVNFRNMPREFREEVLISYPSVSQGIENVAGVTIAETTTQKYAEIKNKIAKVTAKPRITDEAMLGSDLDLYGQLLRLLDEELGRWLALQIYYGDGSTKAFRGLLSSNRVDITQDTGESFKPTINSGNPTLARNPDYYPVYVTGVAGGLPATDIGKVNFFIDMKKQLPTKYLSTAKWRLNRNTLALIEKIRDADDKPIFRDNYQDGTSRILGHSYVIDDDMPDVAEDSLFIIFGDVKQAYSICNGAIDKMLVDPYTSDGNTIVKVDKEFYEIMGKNDAIIIGAATTNSGA